MRIFAITGLLLVGLAGSALAHGCCDDGDRGWSRRHHHRRWRSQSCGAGCYAHSHASVTCGAPHHNHDNWCGRWAHGNCTSCLKDFPANPRDGQEAWVHGRKWEWDADDHRWERD